VPSVPLSSSEKTQILSRQAFKCNQCQTDLEPIGSAQPFFDRTGPIVTKGSPQTSNIVALCPACYAKSKAEPSRTDDGKKRRQRESGPARGAKRFVKTGFDTRKF